MKSSSSWNINRIFLLKILLPVGLTMVLFIVSLYQILIPRFEEIVLDRKREMIRELTRSAWHIADRQQRGVIEGRLTLAEAQQRTIDQISHLRYGNERKDYFWITDYRPVMIVHPFRDDLNGSDLSDFKDSHGKRLFVEMVKTVRSGGEGYVDYTWQWKDDSTRIVPKLSYVESFAPWGWIIGTGIYLEDVRAEIADLERNVIRISLIITVAISLLLLFIAVQNVRSERRRLHAEQELRESKDKYAALVEAATEGLLMVLDGQQIIANRTLLSMLGYSEEESEAISLADLIPAEIGAKLADLTKYSALKEEVISHLEAALRKKDGSLLEALLIVSPISVSGKTGIVVIVRDISHHKEMASALDESREKLLALTNQFMIAMFRTETGKEMRIIEANDATARILGYNRAPDLYGAGLSDLFADPQSFTMIQREMNETGHIKNRIVQLRKKDSQSVALSLSLALIKDDAGAPRYLDCIAEDISEYMTSEKIAHTLLGELQTPLAFLHDPVAPFVRDHASVGMEETVSRAIGIMSRLRARMLFVADSSGRFIGTISRYDACMSNAAADTPVYEVMRAPVVSVHRTTSVYDVLALHFEKQVRHFGVKDERGVFCGCVDVDDLLQSQLRSYLFMLNRLKYAGSIAEVRHCHDALLIHVRTLIAHGSGVENLTQGVTVVSDTIVRKLIALAFEELGPPPAAFVFLALGSEGRQEQTLVTDQDNAILYDDVAAELSEDVNGYFLRLGEWVCNALDGIGYTFCKGKVMAKNPKWCQPLSRWKRYFSDWVTTAEPQDLLDVSIFFDFRSVYGDEALVEALRAHLFRIVSGNNSFFVYMTQNALKAKPPAWQLKAREPLDTKLALLPIVDLARIRSLKHNIHRTNTLERLAHLHERNVFASGVYREMVQVYSLLMTLRYRHQASSFAENAPPGNSVPTASMTELERISLRRALAAIDDFQTMLSLDVKGTM